LQLKDFGTESARVVNGKYDSENFSFSVDKVAYGDVTGDGQEEAFVWVSTDIKLAANPENEYEEEVLVFTIRNGEPTPLAEINPFDVYHDYESRSHPTDECDRGEFLHIRITAIAPKLISLLMTSGSRFCPRVVYHVTMKYQWNGEKFFLTGAPSKRIMRS
jgi:hypothetical protein